MHKCENKRYYLARIASKKKALLPYRLRELRDCSVHSSLVDFARKLQRVKNERRNGNGLAFGFNGISIFKLRANQILNALVGTGGHHFLSVPIDFLSGPDREVT